MKIILFMIFFHIIDDYYLQGVLAKMKQKEWWVTNAPQEKYRFDFIWALIMHSFSWSFMIMLPIMYINNFQLDGVFYLIFFWNVILHSIIDHCKANLKKINLIEDQMLHIIQILATAFIMLYMR